MSIVVDIEPSQRAQVIKQMNKLINVLQAIGPHRRPGRTPRTGAAAGARHACRIARRSSRKPRSSARARWIRSVEGFALEATGDPEKLDEFIDVMRSYGEIEVTRSGLVVGFARKQES